ncbi:MAG: Radical SAM domain protein [Olavius algarvensis Delta 4 endosymbiont]|nr:MAG: Radical SAM domain protein [Olavius algarvensis Delta 4 endosymbiont]
MKVSECTSRPILAACGLKDIDYQVDTYVGCEHYCYYCYALPQAETDWSKEILIYNDIVDQLGKELDEIPPQTIYMGYHTDPYQPCEAEYRQTRKVLALFLKNGFSASILTKSDLVVRDIDILKEMNAAAISVSVAFNDNQTRRLFEANTIDTEKRIAALNKLKEAGVRTGALLCPVIPYITDAIQMIAMLEPYADVIWIYGLSINDRSGQNWLNIQKILRDQSPTLIEQIEPVIFSKDHSYWAELRESLEMLKKDRKLNLNIHI